MLRKIISKEDSLGFDSKKFSVSENTNYVIQTKVIGHKGIQYSAYFVAILLDSNYREIDRKIRWISNFDNHLTTYNLSFTTTSKTKFLILGYRINTETPVKSYIDISFQDPSLLILKIQNNEKQIFDSITNYTIPNFPTLTTKQESNLEKKLVWIIAPPRSGTTWLGSRLLNHSSNIIWNEPWIGFHLGVLRGGLTPARDFHRFSPEDSQISVESLSNVKTPKIDFEFERIIDMQSKNGEYFFSPHHKSNWMPFLRKMILNRTYSHAQSFEKNIIIKDPVSSNGTDILSECFPNSKIIFLVRDGRDEVDSRIDMHKKNSWAGLMPLSDEQERLHAINYYSKLWNTTIKNIKLGFDSHPKDLKILVKYENLKTDTFRELKKIYSFIGSEVTDNDLKNLVDLHDFKNIPNSDKGSGKFNRSATLGSWKKNFDKNEQNLMNLIMKKTLDSLEYT